MEWDPAFTRFVTDNAESMYRTAYMLSGDAHTAGDLVQETLTRLYPKWPLVLAADSDAAYVRRAMINRHLSIRRSRGSRELLLAELPDVVEESPSYSTLLERDAMNRRLGTLPANQRTALVLRYFNDLDDRAGAAALGCPVATYRSLIRRGLAALRPSGQAAVERLEGHQADRRCVE